MVNRIFKNSDNNKGNTILSFEQYKQSVENLQKQTKRARNLQYFFFWLGVCAFYTLFAAISALAIQFCVANLSFGIKITLKDILFCYVIAVLIGFLRKLFPLQ